MYLTGRGYVWLRLSRFAGFVFWLAVCLGLLLLYFSFHPGIGTDRDTAFFLGMMSLVCAYVAFLSFLGWIGAKLLHLLFRGPKEHDY